MTRWADALAGVLIDRVCLAVSATALVSALLVVATQVVARYGLDDSLTWAEEFARYALIWSAFAGAAVAYRRGEHVGVTLLIERLPRVAARIVASTVHFIALAFALVVAWEGWFLTMRVFARGEIATALPMKIAWVYLAVPCGAAFVALAAFAALLSVQMPRVPLASDGRA